MRGGLLYLARRILKGKLGMKWAVEGGGALYKLKPGAGGGGEGGSTGYCRWREEGMSASKLGGKEVDWQLKYYWNP